MRRWSTTRAGCTRSAAQHSGRTLQPHPLSVQRLPAQQAQLVVVVVLHCTIARQRCNMVPCDAMRCSLAAVGVTLTSSCSSCCRRALSPPGASKPRRYCQYAHVPSAGRIPGLHRRRTWVCMRHVRVALPAHRRVTTELGPLPCRPRLHVLSWLRVCLLLRLPPACRRSAGRGLAFEQQIYKRMSECEVADQVRTYVRMYGGPCGVCPRALVSQRAMPRCDPCIAACCLLLGAVPRRLGCFVACRVGAVADLLVCVRSQASSFYAHCRMLTRSGWRSTATLMAGRPPPTAGPKSQCRCGRGEPSPGADVAGVSAVLAQMWQG